MYCLGEIPYRSVRQLAFYKPKHPLQAVVPAFLLLEDLAQQFIECAEDTQPVFVEQKHGADLLKIPQAGLGLRQGQHQDLIQGKSLTVKIDQGKQTLLISVQGIIPALGQQDCTPRCGYIRCPVHGIGDLSADAQGKTVAFTASHIHDLALVRMYGGRLQDIGYDYAFEFFHF